MLRAKKGVRRLLLSLALFAPVMAPLTFPQSVMAQAPAGSDSAEVAFWNSIKDSKSSAEFEAYLQAFPSGLFAPLARLRIQQIAAGTLEPAPPPPGQPPPPRQAQPDPPPAPRPPPPVAVDLSSPQTIREIQDKLYNLNYKIRRFDGVFDTPTRDAIIAWQKNIEVEGTGVMTAALLQRLRNAVPPTVWGSLAYTPSGSHGRSWNMVSRREAEDAAMAECRRRAGRRADCTDPLSASGTNCLAMATYRSQYGGRVYTGAHVSRSSDLATATNNAMRQCQGAERNRGTCVTRVSFCANDAPLRR